MCIFPIDFSKKVYYNTVEVTIMWWLFRHKGLRLRDVQRSRNLFL